MITQGEVLRLQTELKMKHRLEVLEMSMLMYALNDTLPLNVRMAVMPIIGKMMQAYAHEIKCSQGELKRADDDFKQAMATARILIEAPPDFDGSQFV